MVGLSRRGETMQIDSAWGPLLWPARTWPCRLVDCCCCFRAFPRFSALSTRWAKSASAGLFGAAGLSGRADLARPRCIPAPAWFPGGEGSPASDVRPPRLDKAHRTDHVGAMLFVIFIGFPDFLHPDLPGVRLRHLGRQLQVDHASDDAEHQLHHAERSAHGGSAVRVDGHRDGTGRPDGATLLVDPDDHGARCAERCSLRY